MRIRLSDGRLYGVALAALSLWCVWDVTPSRVSGRSATFSTSCPLTVVGSSPADGYFDVRHFQNLAGQPAGVTVVHLQFSEAVELSAADMSLLSSGEAPSIVAVSGAGDQWEILLDAPPRPGSSTAIVFCDGAAAILFHSRPGDINLDGEVDALDVEALETAISAGVAGLSTHDFNRDGAVDAADVDSLAGVLEAGGFSPSGYGVNPNRVLCCCSGGYCSMHIGQACADGGGEAACPCTPNPCSGNANSN